MSDAIEAARPRKLVLLPHGEWVIAECAPASAFGMTGADVWCDPKTTAWLCRVGEELKVSELPSITAYEAAKGGGVDASFPTALSDSEVRIWINACNHEPARQALRQLLAYRVRGVSSALTSPASGERDAVIEVTDAMVEDGAVAIDALWSEGQDRGPAFAETEREYQAHCRSTARAAIVAALRMEGK